MEEEEEADGKSDDDGRKVDGVGKKYGGRGSRGVREKCIKLLTEPGSDVRRIGNEVSWLDWGTSICLQY